MADEPGSLTANERPAVVGPSPSPPRGTRDAWLELLGLLALGFGTVLLLVGTTVAGFAWLIVPIVLATGFIASRAEQLSRRLPAAIPTLVLVSAGLAVLSILTGWLNGLSDEPYSTPAYASLGLAMYSHPVSFDYVQYGVQYHELSYDVYLPLLTFIQIPGIDYRWVALSAWALGVYLFRRDPCVVAGLAAAWIPLLAANGQNDFVPLVAASAAIGLGSYRGRFLVEVLSLGLKQFANVIVFAYHLVRREFRAAAIALVVTIGFLAPFLWLEPASVYCHVLLGDPGTSCSGHSWTFFLFKRNYWLYPTWAALVFHRTVARWGHAAYARLRRPAK